MKPTELLQILAVAKNSSVTPVIAILLPEDRKVLPNTAGVLH